MASITEIRPFPPPAAGEQEAEAVAHGLAAEPMPFTHKMGAEYVHRAASVRPALPDRVLLGSLLDGRLRVVSPIAVNCARENQDIIAEAVELNEFGFGKNLSEAIRDLQAVIVELYFTLEQENNRLGPDLRRVWEILRQKIHRRP